MLCISTLRLSRTILLVPAKVLKGILYTVAERCCIKPDDGPNFEIQNADCESPVIRVFTSTKLRNLRVLRL